MPIIVDEVVISVEVTNNASGGAGAAPPTARERQEIVAECVERVLDVLRHREER